MNTEQARNFQEDLADPKAGLNTDLYSAIEPMIAVDNKTPRSGHDEARIKELKENIRKGLVGLEYMTGLKKNKADTFYDEHPVQAVGTDILKNSPAIGLGIGAGGIGLNYLRQWKNMRKTEGGRMSRSKNPEDATHPLKDLEASADKGKTKVKPEVSRIFGDFEDNIQDRVKIIGDMEGGGAQKTYTDELRKIEAKIKRSKTPKARAAAMEERSKFVNKLRQSDAYAKMQQHANFRQSMLHAKRNGGFKSYLGEWLNTAGGPDHPVFSKLRKWLAPGQEQAIGDLMERHGLIGSNVDKRLIKSIVKEHFQDDPHWAAPGGKYDAFVDTTLKRVSDPKYQRSGLRRTLDRVKYPAALGAGVAVGGSALYHLVKAIQNKAYSSDKTREWKKTLLQSRGDFDLAKKYE